MTHSALYSFLARMLCMGRRWVRCKSRQTHTVYEREALTHKHTRFQYVILITSYTRTRTHYIM